MKWEERSDVVRVDSLTRGQRFESIDRRIYTYERTDSSGVAHVRKEDGSPEVFAALALVIRV